MILKKLRKLNQFVKEQQNEYGFAIDVIKYTYKLDEPLTKEIFVNPFKKPLHVFSDHPDENHSKMYQRCPDVIEWRSAEKKVMFNCDVEINNEFLFSITFNNSDFELRTRDYIVWELSKKHELGYVKITTLHDIAEKTNGELELKGVEV